jgi:hydrogenase small subunit
MAPRIARALAAAPRLPVVWIATQDCTADTESFLRSVDPSVGALLFDLISLDYHETLMVGAGRNAEKSLAAALASPQGYVCIVEGSIPTAQGGIHCTIGGRTALSIVQEVTSKALFTMAVGSCAVDGGLAGAAPNPTSATGVAGAVPGITNLVNMPGCPANGLNMVAALAYYLSFQELPPLDANLRPLFAYQQRIHAAGRCERYAFLQAGQFVEAWGDEGHRNGYCLVHMGCRGPSTYANCYQRNWNETTWPVGVGAPCIGCTTPKFWDVNTPFYVYRARTTSSSTTSSSTPGETTATPSTTTTTSSSTTSSSSTPVVTTSTSSSTSSSTTSSSTTSTTPPPATSTAS